MAILIPLSISTINQQDMVDGSRMNITGGLGWRNKGVFVDLAYIHQIVNDGYYPYRLGCK